MLSLLRLKYLFRFTHFPFFENCFQLKIISMPQFDQHFEFYLEEFPQRFLNVTFDTGRDQKAPLPKSVTIINSSMRVPFKEIPRNLFKAEPSQCSNKQLSKLISLGDRLSDIYANSAEKNQDFERDRQCGDIEKKKEFTILNKHLLSLKQTFFSNFFFVTRDDLSQLTKRDPASAMPMYSNTNKLKQMNT